MANSVDPQKLTAIINNIGITMNAERTAITGLASNILVIFLFKLFT